jgi:UDP-2,3-diacylglucosamine hydrolase
VETLAQLTRLGRRVYVMRGNRDFLLDAPLPAGGAPAFSARCGAVMLEDPCAVRLWGVPALLMHGDALCTDDLQYQAFRAMARRPEWQRGLLARPLAERLAMARALRADSETSKGGKADYLMDVNAQAVAAAMREAGVRLLIHGHTHRPARHAFELDGEAAVRWVLPDWSAAEHRGGLLLAGPEGLEPLGPWSGGR